MIYFTSDTHFGHANVIQYSNRPYQSAEGMNEGLISNWNSVVQPDDTIYHMGDFSFMNEKKTESVIQRLNGKKHLILGNHDKMFKKAKDLHHYFESISEYKEIDVSIGDISTKIILCHYPMVTWNKSHRGSWMIHGHCHGNLRYPMKAKIMDAGVDPQGYFPVSLKQVAKHMDSLSYEALDHHE